MDDNEKHDNDEDDESQDESTPHAERKRTSKKDSKLPVDLSMIRDNIPNIDKNIFKNVSKTLDKTVSGAAKKAKSGFKGLMNVAKFLDEDSDDHHGDAGGEIERLNGANEADSITGSKVQNHRVNGQVDNQTFQEMIGNVD